MNSINALYTPSDKEVLITPKTRKENALEALKKHKIKYPLTQRGSLLPGLHMPKRPPPPFPITP